MIARHISQQRVMSIGWFEIDSFGADSVRQHAGTSIEHRDISVSGRACLINEGDVRVPIAVLVGHLHEIKRWWCPPTNIRLAGNTITAPTLPFMASVELQ